MKENSSTKQSCVSCKLISISCFIGIGCYMFKLGVNQKSRIVYNLIGSACIGLGIGQIFDVSPVRSKV